MMMPAIESLSGGREAIARHAWREAFDVLTEVDASGLLEPQDLGFVFAEADTQDKVAAALRGLGVGRGHRVRESAPGRRHHRDRCPVEVSLTVG